MASFSGKVLFVTTSPRTPAKMIPEIALLQTHFSGQAWSNENQVRYLQLLKESGFFNGSGSKDPAFSARDRVNRAPKALGFVTLKPHIELTPAGKELISVVRPDEIFLRQLLKFQLPSPYHKTGDLTDGVWVKPYLEMFRLIDRLGSLTFDELRIFGLQLVDYRNFEMIVSKIRRFRTSKQRAGGKYKELFAKCMQTELKNIYKTEIKERRFRTRETNEHSAAKFLRTKESNMRDYADAMFRYLRSTGMVSISYRGNTIAIVPERQEEVRYFLKNIDRNPVYVNDLKEYVGYLGDPTLPKLLVDNRVYIEQRLNAVGLDRSVEKSMSLVELKTELERGLAQRRQKSIDNEKTQLHRGVRYKDIIDVYRQIKDRTIYDAPLMLEWNTWRAMVMLNGGEVTANLKFDDYGNPMATAQGNMADITCDYGDYCATIEVTMQSGQRQYETEGESVSRHLALFKRRMNKPGYCLFIAPTINEATRAHFYMLHKTNVSYYDGTLIIVPLTIDTFERMIANASRVGERPEPAQLRELFDASAKLSVIVKDEVEWHSKVSQVAEQLFSAEISAVVGAW